MRIGFSRRPLTSFPRPASQMVTTPAMLRRRKAGNVFLGHEDPRRCFSVAIEKMLAQRANILAQADPRRVVRRGADEDEKDADESSQGGVFCTTTGATAEFRLKRLARCHLATTSALLRSVTRICAKRDCFRAS